MLYPGQRFQIDVKYVPAVCLVNKAKGQKFYQYTAIDEYSRWRFVESFDEHNTYTSAAFLEHLLKAFPLPIECVQTDNKQTYYGFAWRVRPVFSSVSTQIDKCRPFASVCWSFPMEVVPC